MEQKKLFRNSPERVSIMDNESENIYICSFGYEELEVEQSGRRLIRNISIPTYWKMKGKHFKPENRH